MSRISTCDREKFPTVLSEVPWVHLHHKVLFLRTFLHFVVWGASGHVILSAIRRHSSPFSFQVFNMGAVNEFMDIIGLGSVGIGLCKGGVEVYKVAGRMPGGAPVSFRGIATGGSPIQMGALGAYSLFVRCLEVSKKVASAPLLTNSPRVRLPHTGSGGLSEVLDVGRGSLSEWQTVMVLRVCFEYLLISCKEVTACRSAIDTCARQLQY